MPVNSVVAGPGIIITPLSGNSFKISVDPNSLPAGPQGLPGPKGDPGPQGQPGSTPDYLAVIDGSVGITTSDLIPNDTRCVQITSRGTGGEELTALNINGMSGGEEKRIFFLQKSPGNGDVLVLDHTSVFNADGSALQSVKMPTHGGFMRFEVKLAYWGGLGWCLVEHVGAEVIPPLKTAQYA